jgi:hypothetical protein
VIVVDRWRTAPALALFLAGTLVACSSPQTATGPTPLAASAAVTVVDPGTTSTPTSPPPASGASASLVVAGDVGWCGSPAVGQTARLVDGLPGDLLLVGDLAYPNGTPDDFRRCFDPEYGRFRARFRPLPGNHEYDRADAEGYFGYFGAAAGPGRAGYYAFEAGTWQVLAMNSAAPIGRGSAQIDWARQELQRNRHLCTAVAVHHPYESSGQHGRTPFLDDLWQMLYEEQVDVVFNGHEHLYERLVPMAPGRRADPVRGIRQFTVGTGGAPLYPSARPTPNSEVALQVWGVLAATLRPGLMEWRFVEAATGGTADAGVATCH